MKNKIILFIFTIISQTLSTNNFLKKENTDICYGQDGCKFAIKMPIFLPILDNLGEKNDQNPGSFEYKILIGYSNRLVFFETDQDPKFNRDKKPGNLLRTIYLEEISLDCGIDQNKICTIKEFSEIYSNFTVNKVIIFFFSNKIN